ncbi:hypothetical protein ACIRS1_27535 [Kitasatospora sp. NPDC101176]|uniref:hypothetical protein n=1 Tax=Kitasatospora sp. NPDC101176 TaxID=3364099 RepID=UPI003822A736
MPGPLGQRYGVQLGDRRPRTGEQVVVTLDPDGWVDPRLGPPPGPPDTTARTVAPAAVATGALGLGTHLTGLLEALLARRRRPPEDAVPA